MALTSPRIVTSSAGTATAEIVSDQSGGTLSWAVRTTAYTSTDGAAIRDGTGAVDSGDVVAVLGANQVTATGVPLDTDLNFGFVYDPASSASRPIVGGPNALLWSEDLTNAVWTLDKSAIIGGQSDPFGGAFAHILRGDGVSASGYVVAEQQLMSLAANTYTFSVYCKESSHSKVRLQIENAGGDAQGDGASLFDLSSGAVTSSASGHTASIAADNAGFYRAQIAFTTIAQRNIKFNITTGWVDPTLQTGIVVFGPQVNSGTPAAAYSTTEGSAV